MDPVTMAGVGTVASAASSIINPIAQMVTNGRNINQANRMYDVQRRDALADWNRQNEYNSPQAQMERLRKANLNPNLVYGHGADNTAQAVRSSTPSQPHIQAPQFDAQVFQQSLLTHADLKMKQAQTDNLKVQNTVALQEALLKQAQTANTLQSTARSKFDLDLAGELKQNSLQMAAGQLRKLNVDTDVTLAANERAIAMQAPNLQKAAEEILTMRMNRSKTIVEKEHIKAQIDNLQKDAKLKQLSIDLQKQGIQPNDNFFLRLLGRHIGDVSNTFDDLKKGWKAGSFDWMNPFK